MPDLLNIIHIPILKMSGTRNYCKLGAPGEVFPDRDESVNAVRCARERIPHITQPDVKKCGISQPAAPHIPRVACSRKKLYIDYTIICFVLALHLNHNKHKAHYTQLNST